MWLVVMSLGFVSEWLEDLSWESAASRGLRDSSGSKWPLDIDVWCFLGGPEWPYNARLKCGSLIVFGWVLVGM